MRDETERLTNMFNKIKNATEYSLSWKTAIIFPMYKEQENRKKKEIMEGFHFY
jgi:hypothetical protein